MHYSFTAFLEGCNFKVKNLNLLQVFNFLLLYTNKNHKNNQHTYQILNVIFTKIFQNLLTTQNLEMLPQVSKSR